MNQEQQNKTQALCGSFIFMVLFFLFLWFMTISIPVPEEDEGIEVAFGAVQDAGGFESRQSEAVPVPAQTAPAPAKPVPSNNDLMTQEDEESLALQRAQDEKRRREQELALAEQQRLEREKAEAEAKARAEKEAWEKAEAERQAKEQAAAIAKANQFGSLFGKNGNNANGSGDGKGDGQKGNPVGRGSQGAGVWSLAGRECRTMGQPSKDFKQEGVVVVSIQVDAAGNVTGAAVGKGTTISDYATQQIALKAARETKFSKGSSNIQIGTITYTFKFK